MAICEVTERTNRWPYVKRCREQAVGVAIWEEDGNDYSKKVCRTHREEAYITPDVSVKEFVDGNS